MKPSIKVTAIAGALMLGLVASDNALAKHRHHHYWYHFTPHFRYVYLIPTNPNLYINQVAVKGFVGVPFATIDRAKAVQLDTISGMRSGYLLFEVKDYSVGGCEAKVALPLHRNRWGNIVTPTGTFSIMFPSPCAQNSAMLTVSRDYRHGYVVNIQ
ncbi:hypothetical protein AYO45_03425 [Gammaproteobacteria bacterium SCGC AG-212-F23]|nr:hypothetical protein AYO45_03425 [Gammaproteobacteria bacterium SCGC AG-212-F23]